MLQCQLYNHGFMEVFSWTIQQRGMCYNFISCLVILQVFPSQLLIQREFGFLGRWCLQGLLCVVIVINMCLLYLCMFYHKFPKGEIINVKYYKVVTKRYFTHFTYKTVLSPCRVPEVSMKTWELKVSSFIGNGVQAKKASRSSEDDYWSRLQGQRIKRIKRESTQPIQRDIASEQESTPALDENKYLYWSRLQANAFLCFKTLESTQDIPVITKMPWSRLQ